MRDIENKADIELLINSFYDEVKVDPVIGFIFNEIIGADWSHHLPVMYEFWNMVLFSQPGYAGNPTRKHVEIDKRIALEREHFERWTYLWNKNADALFEGPNATIAKERAALMATLISTKVEMGRGGNLIQ